MCSTHHPRSRREGKRRWQKLKSHVGWYSNLCAFGSFIRRGRPQKIPKAHACARQKELSSASSFAKTRGKWQLLDENRSVLGLGRKYTEPEVFLDKRVCETRQTEGTNSRRSATKKHEISRTLLSINLHFSVCGRHILKPDLDRRSYSPIARENMRRCQFNLLSISLNLLKKHRMCSHAAARSA